MGAADERAMAELCSRYVESVAAYTRREPLAGGAPPDERLMRSIEEQLDIAEQRKDEFRREIMNYVGALAVEGRPFELHMNQRPHRAIASVVAGRAPARAADRPGPITVTISGTSAALLAQLCEGQQGLGGDPGAVLMRALGLLDLALKAKREGKKLGFYDPINDQLSEVAF